jgi:hypothetical protein
MAIVGTKLGGAAPGGALISIAASVTNAAAIGDLVVIAFAWATGFQSLATVTDTNSNTWTVVGTNAALNECGGYGWTIVTSGWATNTVTGTLGGGTPGGRVWTAAKVAAANLVASPFDQNTQTSVTSLTPSVTTSSFLAQPSEACFVVDVVRASGSTTVPTWAWNSGWTEIDHQTGANTANSGVAIAEFDNTTGTSPVSGGFTGTTSGDNHGLGIIAFKLAGGTPPATADAPRAYIANPELGLVS